ncbi:hypothetical protein C8Q80DRAFT_1218968 [Daedaleopsis nitida]|nr:hypothetical protein C8Q80DRAFT_1218968 [Daedaleopsis nitida]
MWPFNRRSHKLPHSKERVLILGASSGVGRAIAHRYASYGARVCVVARREEELAKVVEECKRFRAEATKAKKSEDAENVFLAVRADFAVVDDVLNLRAKVEAAWGGIDTLIVSAAVMTLRPLYELAGLSMEGRTFTPPQVDKDGVERVVEVATRTMRSNYIGPLIAFTTFIPMLAASPAPATLLISSLGAVVPAPTLSIYNSSKAASLMLFQVLAIEYPYIAFTRIMPAVIRGDAFFANSVDGGAVRTADPSKNGLTHEEVARRCVTAVDRGEQAVFLPAAMGWFAHFVYWLVPSILVSSVNKMYKYEVKY